MFSRSQGSEIHFYVQAGMAAGPQEEEGNPKMQSPFFPLFPSVPLQLAALAS